MKFPFMLPAIPLRAARTELRIWTPTNGKTIRAVYVRGVWNDSYKTDFVQTILI